MHGECDEIGHLLSDVFGSKIVNLIKFDSCEARTRVLTSIECFFHDVFTK